MSKIYFSLASGRSGSAWLAEFLSTNLGFDAVHEPLGIEDFGTRMPSIRLMRSFNSYGSNQEVRRFWQQKLDELPTDEPYAETNHTLGKCGLIEAIADHPRAPDTTVIVLRRSLSRQCASYINRHDFSNITTLWQWYLTPQYPSNIVNSAPFEKMGQSGTALWYTLEMECRQTYYERLFGDRIRFVHAQLEEITRPQGAAAFLAELGHVAAPILPDKKNASQIATSQDLVAKIDHMIAQLGFDPDGIVDRYLDTFGAVDVTKRTNAA
ncbi:hypothetical protein [Tritonibacter horizontis]|uniref:Sulfotransferase domain protein n=1 Tax=Tritonibacter horizontis TaxID=1768241 RepID=A0A132BWF9_9RHOB|nr:hypothetical protein [Tritonibacter horizontis]KUP92536.1 hypothetical protein TRIHO_25060 [Tritonibacter horizontis]